MVWKSGAYLSSRRFSRAFHPTCDYQQPSLPDKYMSLCMSPLPAQVLLWVLRACPQDLHKFLKCNWQLDQPAIVENWLVRPPASFRIVVNNALDCIMISLFGEGRVKQRSAWGETFFAHAAYMYQSMCVYGPTGRRRFTYRDGSPP